MYKKLVLGSSFGSIGLALPFSLWFITTRQLAPMADLWFGSRSVAPFMPFAMLSILPMFLILGPMNKYENRLYGNKAPEDPPTIPVSVR